MTVFYRCSRVWNAAIIKKPNSLPNPARFSVNTLLDFPELVPLLNQMTELVGGMGTLTTFFAPRTISFIEFASLHLAQFFLDTALIAESANHVRLFLIGLTSFFNSCR